MCVAIKLANVSDLFFRQSFFGREKLLIDVCTDNVSYQEQAFILFIQVHTSSECCNLITILKDPGCLILISCFPFHSSHLLNQYFIMIPNTHLWASSWSLLKCSKEPNLSVLVKLHRQSQSYVLLVTDLKRIWIEEANVDSVKCKVKVRQLTPLNGGNNIAIRGTTRIWLEIFHASWSCYKTNFMFLATMLQLVLKRRRIRLGSLDFTVCTLIMHFPSDHVESDLENGDFNKHMVL
jgi:hypothetical protein